MTKWAPLSERDTKETGDYFLEDFLRLLGLNVHITKGMGIPHWGERSITGFRGTHYPSGACMKDYGSIVIDPQAGSLDFGSSTRDTPMENIKSSPEYFSCVLKDDFDLKVEVTTTPRSGFFRLTSLGSGDMHVLVDAHRGTMEVHPNNNEIIGHNPECPRSSPTGAFSGYFVIKFDRPFTDYGKNGGDVGGSVWLYIGGTAGAVLMAYGFLSSRSKKQRAFLILSGLIVLSIVLWIQLLPQPSSKAHATFSVNKGDVIRAKVGTSFISIKQARKNLEKEIPDWDFDKVRGETRRIWNEELSKIEVEGGTEKQKIKFYTALYHALLLPRVSSEYGRYYSVFDAKVHPTEGDEYYNDLSLWDTYRAEHSLLSLLEPKRQEDICQSFVRQYEEGGWIAKWPNPGYSSVMIGTHSDSVIAETYLKGLDNFDIETAYEASLKHATKEGPSFYEGRRGIRDYMKLGYVPADRYGEATSRTLEFAYDDWCLAQLARALERENDYEMFMERAGYYKNVFDPDAPGDPSPGFVRGRNSDGSWTNQGIFSLTAWSRFFTDLLTALQRFLTNFMEISHRFFINFLTALFKFITDLQMAAWRCLTYYKPTAWYEYTTESTPYQYSWYVPHDVQGLIDLMGGGEKFNKKLDYFFEHSKHGKGPDQSVYYWHGNEPSQHVAFLYDWSGKPWRTQELARMIMRTRYWTIGSALKGGLSGNDDCGQTSAWYVFNAMGFYPVNPASLDYAIGSPIFNNVTIHLPDYHYGGKDFVIEARNVSDENMYIQSASLNGEPLEKPWITHLDVAEGGKLTFEMGPEPNKEWGSDPEDAPPSMSK